MHSSEPRPPGNDLELESIAGLIDDVFKSPQTTGAHRSMTRMHGFDRASLPTVWDTAGRPVATVQAVPCEVSLMGTWVPAGIITMVATAPEARGKGYMRACMEAAHRWMLAHGRPVGILYGVPAIYPKFGYRPVMPRAEIEYGTPADARTTSTRAVTEADVATLANLFNHQEAQRPCAVKRGGDPWVWRSVAGHSSLRCVEQDGNLNAYLRSLGSGTSGSQLTIVEAACKPGSEAILLDAVHGLADQAGAQSIVLKLMPDHPLVSELDRRVTSLEIDDVVQQIFPPQAGMLAVLDASAALQSLRPRIEARLESGSLRITAGEALDVTFGTGQERHLELGVAADLAHLLTGYPGARALKQWGRLEGRPESIDLATHLFPAAWPRWILAPFWDE